MSPEDEACRDAITRKIESPIDDPYLMLSEPILTVPPHLRRIKNEAYEPDIISIGPYHRGKDHLAAMEGHKFRYLKLLLHRRNERIETYVEALSQLGKRAKDSYDKQFFEGREHDDFLETMLVDGCFIVELIRKGAAEDWRSERYDPISGSRRTLYSVKKDLLLVENQLPFFILEKLFDMTLLPDEESKHLVDMIFGFFRILPGPGYKRGEGYKFPKPPVPHLLGLIHDNWLPSPQCVNPYLNDTDQEKQSTKGVLCLSIDQGLIYRNQATRIQCATKLNEAGIKFKRAEGCSIFDIKFENGVLEIPKLTIDSRTESLLRNLIAYEQFREDDLYHATDYTNFMDCLINSEKDVELLCRNGIIDNLLGDDEVIASMLNGLLVNVLYPGGSLYTEIYEKVNKHCSREWNVWKAKLRHDYFNGPWALISFLAALFLLLFTGLQTVYSVLSNYSS